MAIISMFYIISLCIVPSFIIALLGGKHYLHNQLLFSFPCIKG